MEIFEQKTFEKPKDTIGNNLFVDLGFAQLVK